MFGKKLSYFRRLREYSQDELGTALGVTRQTINKWEKGESLPDVLVAKRITELLHISLEDLLENDEKDMGEMEELDEPQIRMGPEQRYVFGKVIVGLAGQVKIPKEARQALGIESGDELVVLGDLERGIELVYASLLWKGIRTEEKEFVDGAQ